MVPIVFWYVLLFFSWTKAPRIWTVSFVRHLHPGASHSAVFAVDAIHQFPPVPWPTAGLKLGPDDTTNHTRYGIAVHFSDPFLPEQLCPLCTEILNWRFPRDLNPKNDSRAWPRLDQTLGTRWSFWPSWNFGGREKRWTNNLCQMGQWMKPGILWESISWARYDQQQKLR